MGVCGPVGSGKSALLSAIVGQMVRVGGDAALAGTLSYASQQPWIQNMTLRSSACTYLHKYLSQNRTVALSNYLVRKNAARKTAKSRRNSFLSCFIFPVSSTTEFFSFLSKFDLLQRCFI